MNVCVANELQSGTCWRWTRAVSLCPSSRPALPISWRTLVGRKSIARHHRRSGRLTGRAIINSGRNGDRPTRHFRGSFRPNTETVRWKDFDWRVGLWWISWRSTGVNSPRLAEGDVELPSARVVSQWLTESSHRASQSDVWTLMLMQWGQFLDHDLTHSPIVRGQNASGVTCCKDGQFIDRSSRHPDCFPITIPENDGFYQQFGQRCMEFVRSLPAVRPQCTFGPREQLNQVTAFVDGSTVYGSSDEMVEQLREFVGGRLAMQRTISGQKLLPVKVDECSDFLRQRFCFRAGFCSFTRHNSYWSWLMSCVIT